MLPNLADVAVTIQALGVLAAIDRCRCPWIAWPSCGGAMTIRRGTRGPDQRSRAMLEPLLPIGKEPGRPAVSSRRQLVNGIRWRTRTGARGGDVPERYGPWDRAYDPFRRWQ